MSSPICNRNSPLVGIPVPHGYFDGCSSRNSRRVYRAVWEIQDALHFFGASTEVFYPSARAPAFDALLIPGGGDIDPLHYGQQGGKHLVESDPVFDAFQLKLVRSALDHGMPIFGICRGLQVLNVAAGGTVLQSIPSLQDHFPIWNWDNPKLRRRPTHHVSVSLGSRLGGILRVQQIRVNSYHSQAVGVVAPGFRATAWADDNTVEAIEREGVWQLGVQFHPEDLRHTDERFSNLFQSFATAALEFRNNSRHLLQTSEKRGCQPDRIPSIGA